MCASPKSGRSSRPNASITTNDTTNEDEMKAEEAFKRLSADTIAKLIYEEPDVYSIADVKVRYK